MWSLHGDHAIKDVLTSNLQIENLFFSQHSHHGIRICKLAILRSKFLSFHSGHCMSTINGYKLLCFFSSWIKPKFLQKQTKKSRREIVISASHFRRLNFFIIHFLLEHFEKKRVFLLRQLDFFSSSSRTLSGFTNPTILRQERPQVELRI